MRLSSIKVGGRCVIALRSGRDLVDLSAADHGLPGELALLLEQWPTVGERLSELALAPPSAALVDETDIEWLPPIPRPGKLLCLGLNYADHAAESRYEKPAWQSCHASPPGTARPCALPMEALPTSTL